MGCNVKFSSKSIKPELEGLNRILTEFQQLEQQLSTFCDPDHRVRSLQAIQDASRQIQSSNILGDIAGVWEEWKAHEQKQKDLEVERSQKEGVLKIKEAEKDFLNIRLNSAAEETKRVQQMLEDKKAEVYNLKQNKDVMGKDFIFCCQAAKESNKRRVEELQKKMREDEENSRVPVNECEEKIAELQRQSLNLPYNINHVIFAVDNSYSMSGQRYKLAMKAVEDFRNACVSAGSQDKVSLVCFNDMGKRLARAVPMTQKLQDKLYFEGCSNGTSFLAAWEQIEKCVDDDPKFAKIFVVFLTDGYSGDVDLAAAKAQAIFNLAEQHKRPMTASFVYIHEGSSNPKVEAILEPLVKAANGGQTVVRYMEETIPLLQIVKSEDLVQAFVKLTSLVNLHRCILDVQMSLLQNQEKEFRSRQMEASKSLQARLKDDIKRLEDAEKEAEKKSKTGTDQMDLLYKALQKHMDDDVCGLKKELETVQTIEADLKKKVVQCESDHKGLQAEFEKSKEGYEQMSENLQKMTLTHLEQTKKIHDRQKQLVDRFGSTNSMLLASQLESLQQMKDQLSRNSVIEEDRSCCVFRGECPLFAPRKTSD